jgi:HEAT repeat protein
MESDIERLREESDADGLLRVFSAGIADRSKAREALANLPDPARAVDPLIALLKNGNEFIQRETRTWLDHWKGMGPPHSTFGEAEARDSATADYVKLAFLAIRLFQNVGGPQGIEGLRLLANSGVDPDVREDASAALKSIEGG